jgi:hypothetical protein
VRRAFLAADLLDGSRVKQNRAVSGGATAQWPIAHVGPASVRAGLSLLGMAYAYDLGRFTIGHGGYFSPQAFIHSGIPVHLEAGGSIRWRLDVEPGMNWIGEARTPTFPLDPAAGGFYPARQVAGLALDAAGGASLRVWEGLEATARLEAHSGQDYRELVAAIAITWRSPTGP